MAKQIKVFGGNWIGDLEREVNKFIKDKNIVELRYSYKEHQGMSGLYHNVFIVYEVNDHDKID